MVRAFLVARARTLDGGPRTPTDAAVELELVERLRPLIQRAALRVFADVVREHRRAPVLSVADLVQASFTKLFEDPLRTLGRWDARVGPLEAYVQRIMRNTMLNLVRGERRRQRRISSEVDLEAVVSEAPPSDSIGVRFAHRVVAAFHAEASPAEATLYREVMVEELSAAEVALRHGWRTNNTTNVWRHRLVRRLRAIAERLRQLPPER